jgi:hypothetical protein
MNKELATMEERYQVVAWLRNEHVTEYALVDMVAYEQWKGDYEPVMKSAVEFNLIGIASKMNKAYRQGVNDAEAKMPPRTVQFDENTWNMLNKIIEAGNREAQDMLDSHPVIQAIAKASKIDPDIYQAFLDAKEKSKKNPILADRFLSAFIKDTYIDALKRGSVRV